MIVNINNLNKGFSEIPNNWKTTENKYNTLEASVHFADGFRTVVEPTIDEATQYKGVIFYDSINDMVTYPVINYTQVEIDARLVSQEESDDRSDTQILETKGNALYARTKRRLIRRRKRGILTFAQCKKVREALHPIFLMLNTGDIDLANDNAVLIPTNTVAKVETELTWFKNEVAIVLTEVNSLL